MIYERLKDRDGFKLYMYSSNSHNIDLTEQGHINSLIKSLSDLLSIPRESIVIINISEIQVIGVINVNYPNRDDCIDVLQIIHHIFNGMRWSNTTAYIDENQLFFEVHRYDS